MPHMVRIVPMTTKSAQVRHVRVSLPLIECLVDGVRYFRKALHAKAKAKAGYRFYALYDKISREDILAYAFAQCRSNTA
jgi:hypothetical protein